MRVRTKQASEITGIPEATLRWWRHSGTGPRSYNLGRTVFYDVVDLDYWAEEQKRATSVGGA
jgi:DNA-binding transcriptional MerR regulator